jgi:hypothetical protein
MLAIESKYGEWSGGKHMGVLYDKRVPQKLKEMF